MAVFQYALVALFYFCLIPSVWGAPLQMELLGTSNISRQLQQQKGNGSTEKAGDLLVVAMPLFMMTDTLLAEPDRSGFDSFATAFVANQIVTYSLKATVNKNRPNGSCCDSFPSGHTSTAFTAAAFAHARYDQAFLSIPMYVLASYVGYSRVYADKHYPEDVIAGALIGTISAFAITRPYIASTDNQKRRWWLTAGQQGETKAVTINLSL